MGKLQHLETFIQVVEANSLALAAKRLGLSSAAVSKQISTLESDLKLSLLSRTTRRLELTEIGHVYYEHCKKIMKKVKDLDEMMDAQQMEPSGLLRVLSSRYFANRWIIPHLQEFFIKYPNITLDITIVGQTSDLSRQDVDLFFGLAHAMPSGIIQREVAQGYFSLCASPSYLEHHGIPKNPQDLSRHHFITYSVRQSCHQLSFNNGQQIYLNPLMSVNDTNMMVSCALQGLGFIKLHQLEAEGYLSTGSLVEVLAEFREPPEPIYLGYSQENYLQPKVRYFIEFYLKKLKKEREHVL
ncbi:MAG: LysR family transcriptional regulator [Chlamydiales bacterium]|nr:LysR family transcriptional regulator [Chlamydiales bacterium]MBY0462560.1 LysR family transcriptional regulator [Alphaproteobacteria bacterium]